MKHRTLSIRSICTVQPDDRGNLEIPFPVGQEAAARIVPLKCEISLELLEKQNREPIPLVDELGPGFWMFRNRILSVQGDVGVTNEELLIHIKHHVFRADSNWKRMKSQIDAFESLERAASARREKLTETVRMFVWQRDEGKCVKCGSREKLEFDHIIPVADGGSSTERNIQLLCESCNRQKGKNVR